MRRPLTPGENARVDQALAALHDGEARWPHNELVQADERMEQLLLEGLRGPEDWAWSTVRPGHVWLLWPAAFTAEECPPGREVADVAIESFPRYAATTACERCGAREPIHGGVVMNAGAVNVGVLVCVGCAAELEANHGPVTWTRPGREE